MRMGPIVCPETSVRNYRYWLRNDPEERSFVLFNCSLGSFVRWSVFSVYFIYLCSPKSVHLPVNPPTDF